MKVYVVRKNADFTEGRGPMLLHKIFSDAPLARAYVERQKGIYGSPQGLNKHYEEDDEYHYNGYSIQGVKVLDSLISDEEKEKLESEKQKLARRIAEINEALKT